jgi:hypothetical protein
VHPVILAAAVAAAPPWLPVAGGGSSLERAEGLARTLDAGLADQHHGARSSRPARDHSDDSTLGVGLGDDEAETTLRSTRRDLDDLGELRLRLSPGARGSLFVGTEVPVPGGPLDPAEFYPVGIGMDVEPAGPAGQTRTTITRRGPPLVAPGLGGAGGISADPGGVQTSGRTRTRDLRLRTGFREGVRRNPNARFYQGGNAPGIPTGRFFRTPLSGTLRWGGSRRGSSR